MTITKSKKITPPKNSTSGTASTKMAPNPPLFVLRTALDIKALQISFLSLFPKKAITLWTGGKVFYIRAFTPLVILWYLAFQHISGDSTLDAVTQDALNGGADRLNPRGKGPSKLLHSASTAAWCVARGRLPLSVVHKALKSSGQTIRSTVQNYQWHSMTTVLVDGTTARARPHGDIAKEFPPHTSKSSHPYWCLARSVVALCPATGVVLDCAIGSTKESEQALFKGMLTSGLWSGSLFVADRNFGVFSVVSAAVQSTANVLVRMTEVRANKLAKDNNITLRNGLDQQVLWSPSPTFALWMISWL